MAQTCCFLFFVFFINNTDRHQRVHIRQKAQDALSRAWWNMDSPQNALRYQESFNHPVPEALLWAYETTLASKKREDENK